MKKILIAVLLVSLFSIPIFAGDSGSLDFTLFPKIGAPGPLAQSKLFIAEAEVKGGTAEVQLPIDTPSKAMAAIMGEKDALLFDKDNRVVDSMSYTDSNMRTFSLPEAGTRYDLKSLKKGKNALSLTRVKGNKVKMLVTQPESPLSLDVMVKPLAARSGETVTVIARISDQKFPKSAILKATYGKGSNIALNDKGAGADQIAGDGIYTGTFKAPKVKGFKGLKIQFTATGKRFTDIDFQRDAVTNVMITSPVSKIEHKNIYVSQGTIQVPVKAANGRFRISAIYGYDDMALAYSNEDFTLKGNAGNISITIPESALSANKALIKLLNVDTLGLEDEVEISLTPSAPAPDKSLIEMKRSKSNSLPPSKANAIELLKLK